MPELVSEPITPRAGTSDAVRMAGGEPGLPTGFTWHGDSFEIVELLARISHQMARKRLRSVRKYLL